MTLKERQKVEMDAVNWYKKTQKKLKRIKEIFDGEYGDKELEEMKEIIKGESK